MSKFKVLCMDAIINTIVEIKKTPRGYGIRKALEERLKHEQETKKPRNKGRKEVNSFH